MRLNLLTIIFALAGVLVLTTADASYTQQYLLSQDATFRQQVSVALVQTCANAMTEAAGVPGHTQRMALCVQVLQDPAHWVPDYSAVLASQNNNPMTPLTLPSTVADSLVQTASDAQLSNVAGYFLH